MILSNGMPWGGYHNDWWPPKFLQDMSTAYREAQMTTVQRDLLEEIRSRLDYQLKFIVGVADKNFERKPSAVDRLMLILGRNSFICGSKGFRLNSPF
jgi:hypothetical protein